jgi:hypothetical protein
MLEAFIKIGNGVCEIWLINNLLFNYINNLMSKANNFRPVDELSFNTEISVMDNYRTTYNQNFNLEKNEVESPKVKT